MALYQLWSVSRFTVSLTAEDGAKRIDRPIELHGKPSLARLNARCDLASCLSFGLGDLTWNDKLRRFCVRSNVVEKETNSGELLWTVPISIAVVGFASRPRKY